MLRRPLLLVVIAVVAAGCGARTPLEVLPSDAGSPGLPDAAGLIPAADRCPSAVLAGAPKPMGRYCSTRDGRTRAPAPRAAHVTWTGNIPITDGSHALGASTLTTDASGHAYFAAAGGYGGSQTMQRIDSATGVVDWAMAPQGVPLALLLSTGKVETTDGDPLTLASIDPASGVESPFATLGYWDDADYAIGADGSFYFVYGLDLGSANPSRQISRVGPDGAVAWTSVSLATLGPPPLYGDVNPSGIALGRDDTVLVSIDVPRKDTTYDLLIALAPDTGQVRWTHAFTDQVLGSPIVAADGSIVVAVVGLPNSTQIVVLEATGQVRRSFAVPAPAASQDVFGLLATALDGTLIVETDGAQGASGLVAVTPTGAALWHSDLQLLDATVTSDGSVLARDSFDLTLLDLATGSTRWVLSPPHPGVCISEAEITSSGGIVGLQCDGTLFGAAD
jgi:outer membrane protein assembly factor BamB